MVVYWLLTIVESKKITSNTNPSSAKCLGFYCYDRSNELAKFTPKSHGQGGDLWHLSNVQNTYDISLYWLVSRDPYSGWSLSLYNRVVNLYIKYSFENWS